MNKVKGIGGAACALLLLIAILQAWPQSAWGQTNEICYDCHSGRVIMTPHHNLGLPSCFSCHTVGSGPFGSFIFLPPDCQECHLFAGGPGGTIHDFHTNLIPSQIPDCEACHVGGAPGGPLREPFAECDECHTGFTGGPGGPLHDFHTAMPEGTNCANCHGSNAPACNLCHDVISSDFPGQMLHDFRNGPGGEGHDFHTGFIPDCTNCHTSGAPSPGAVKEPYADSCAPCHAFNGPGEGSHDLHTGFNPNCLTCHGPEAPACVECHQVPANQVQGLLGHDFRSGPGSPSHDFHTGFIPDCMVCHRTEVPDPGPVREPYTNSCAPCHAFNGPGEANHDLHTGFNPNCGTCHGPQAPVCVECHQVPANSVDGLLGHDFRFGPGSPSHDFHTGFIGECETCHLSGAPDVTPIHEVGNIECTGCHYTNLLPQHQSRCGLCHSSTDPQVQQAIANDNIDCRACHGQMPHAMDCMLCHNDQNPNNFLGTRSRQIHDEHMDKLACGVCHDIRDVSPSTACGLCHSPRSFSSSQSVHRVHLRRFDTVARPCFWCHGLNVPPAPANVCNLCHSGRSGNMQTAHSRHGEDFVCTVCHDNVAGFNFNVAAGTPRDQICTFCHSVRDEGMREVHEEHLGKAQCFTCHGNANVYAATRGDLDCSICHGFENEGFREVHQEHTGEGAMCAVCHSAVPPSVQGVQGEDSIPGYGTDPDTTPLLVPMPVSEGPAPNADTRTFNSDGDDSDSRDDD